MDDHVDNTGPVRRLGRLRRGYARITANNGGGSYDVTELHWDGSTDQDADAPGYLADATARDWNGRDSGQAGDRVLFWEQLRQDGRREVVIDLAGGDRLADDLLKIETSASDGTRIISDADWTDRQIHYELTIGYNMMGDAPAPTASFLAMATTYHDTAYCGSSVGSGWHDIVNFIAGGGVLKFQVDDSSGHLRWSWSNASGWPGDTWYRIRAWATAAKTAYDYTAS